MKEIMINTIKEDITYMLTELGNMRKIEQGKDTKNKLMENSGLSQDAVGYIVYIKDFRPYRKMVDSLNKAYDNLNQMCRYNMSKEDILFMDNFVISLFVETGELHKLMEDCKGDYDQYRCLSDAYTRLTDKICRIERDRPLDFIHQKESMDLEMSLSTILDESRDVVNIAESLGISIEKCDYQNALYSLNVELINWVKQASYPIKISKDQRVFIKTLFSNVQNAKSVLINKISSVKSETIDAKERTPMYIDCIWTEGRDSNKVLIYVDKKLITLDSRRYQEPISMKSYANMIHDMAIKKGYEIYVNTQGFGMSLYDYLIEFGDLKVCELEVSRKG